MRGGCLDIKYVSLSRKHLQGSVNSEDIALLHLVRSAERCTQSCARLHAHSGTPRSNFFYRCAGQLQFQVLISLTKNNEHKEGMPTTRMLSKTAFKKDFQRPLHGHGHNCGPICLQYPIWPCERLICWNRTTHAFQQAKKKVDCQVWKEEGVFLVVTMITFLLLSKKKGGRAHTFFIAMLHRSAYSIVVVLVSFFGENVASFCNKRKKCVPKMTSSVSFNRCLQHADKKFLLCCGYRMLMLLCTVRSKHSIVGARQ